MLVFLLLVVTSVLFYYLGILSILMALVSILGKLFLIVALPLTGWLVWKRYRRLP